MSDLTPEQRSAYARWVAGHGRPRRPRVCAQCGKGYEGAGRSRFCSAACRTAAYRARRQHAAPPPGPDAARQQTLHEDAAGRIVGPPDFEGDAG